MSETESPVSPAALLTQVRETPKYHWLGFVVALVLGLVAASVHWIGLVVGGALVGTVATSLRRAVLAGLGFGVLVLVIWTLLFVTAGTFGAIQAMGMIPLLGAGMALLLPLLGSLVRGVF